MVIFRYEVEDKLQKQRFYKSPKNIKLHFGEFSIVSLNEGRIELVHLNLMKKIMKKLVNKATYKGTISREKIWQNLSINYILQCKGKNSRMGKGKGMFERKLIRVKKGTTLFEFRGVTLNKLFKLNKKIQKKLDINTCVYYPNLTYFNLWSKNNKYFFYYNKYLRLPI